MKTEILAANSLNKLQDKCKENVKCASSAKYFVGHRNSWLHVYFYNKTPFSLALLGQSRINFGPWLAF